MALRVKAASVCILMAVGAWQGRRPGFIFEALHDYKDPPKSTSKNVNGLLKDAGAHPGVQVFHSLRGDGITEMREENIDPRGRRLQALLALAALLRRPGGGRRFN